MAPSRKLLIGSAGAAALGLRVARALHVRWRKVALRQPAQLGPGTGVGDRPAAADATGLGAAEPDYAEAAARLRAAGAARPPRSADAASPAPEISAGEVEALKGDLRRELERLAGSDVKASRTRLRTWRRG